MNHNCNCIRVNRFFGPETATESLQFVEAYWRSRPSPHFSWRIYFGFENKKETGWNALFLNRSGSWENRANEAARNSSAIWFCYCLRLFWIRIGTRSGYQMAKLVRGRSLHWFWEFNFKNRYRSINPPSYDRICYDLNFARVGGFLVQLEYLYFIINDKYQFFTHYILQKGKKNVWRYPCFVIC